MENNSLLRFLSGIGGTTTPGLLLVSASNNQTKSRNRLRTVLELLSGPDALGSVA